MKHRQTQLLALLVLMASVACAASYSQFQSRRSAAAEARRDLLESNRDLADIARVNGGAAPAPAVNVDNAELNRRLRDAASTAGIADKLTSIEPGQPNRVPNADYEEIMVALRLEPLSLKQLVTFLHELGTSDRSSRAKSIELGTPQGAESGDTWSADVTVAYLTYSPREEKP